MHLDILINFSFRWIYEALYSWQLLPLLAADMFTEDVSTVTSLLHITWNAIQIRNRFSFGLPVERDEMRC